jgi:hypothetical protein
VTCGAHFVVGQWRQLRSRDAFEPFDVERPLRAEHNAAAEKQ